MIVHIQIKVKRVIMRSMNNMGKELVEQIKKFQKWSEEHGHKDTFNNYMWYKENILIKRGEL